MFGSFSPPPPPPPIPLLLIHHLLFRLRLWLHRRHLFLLLSTPYAPSSTSDILQHPTAPSPISQAGILGYTRFAAARLHPATVPPTWRRGLIELISFNGWLLVLSWAKVTRNKLKWRGRARLRKRRIENSAKSAEYWRNIITFELAWEF